MTTPQEPMESIRERARRALRDNDEARLQAQTAGTDVRVVPEPATPYRPAPALADSLFRRDPAVVPDTPFRRDPAVVTDTAYRRDLAIVESLLRGTGDNGVQPETAAAPEPLAMQAEAPPEEEQAPVKQAAALVQQRQGTVREESLPEISNLLAHRMAAIRLVRELEPRRTCFRQRVQELQQRLSLTPTDSVHYAQLLQRLAEVHAELNRLEDQMEEGQHIIRSTEWLMEMLTDPTRSWGRKAGEELDAVGR